MPRKRRSLNQIKEERSYTVLRGKLPEAWVMHEYGPDYGIDCVVELFDYIDESQEIAETLGELFFVQLKASASVDYTTRRVYPRGNVEKGPLKEDTSEYYDLPVAKFVLETSELQTVRAMGPAVPVLLILVDVVKEKAFFVCLNDYIDKVMIPEDKDSLSKDNKTIYIPVANEIERDEDRLVPLRAYGKRAKMYGAFTKFNYQKKEIDRALGLAALNHEISEESFRFMIRAFVETSLNQDIWISHDFWKPVPASHAELMQVKSALEAGINSSDFPAFVHKCHGVWHRLENLSNMYEELVREWFMPTFLARLCSYPGYEPPCKAV